MKNWARRILTETVNIVLVAVQRIKGVWEGLFIAASGLNSTLITTPGFPRLTTLTMTTSTFDLGC